MDNTTKSRDIDSSKMKINDPLMKSKIAPKKNKNYPSTGNKRDWEATKIDVPNRNKPQKTEGKENIMVAVRPKEAKFNEPRPAKFKKLKKKSSDDSKTLEILETDQVHKESEFENEIAERNREMIFLLKPLMKHYRNKILPACEAVEYLKKRYRLCRNYLKSVGIKNGIKKSGEDITKRVVESKVAKFKQQFKELEGLKIKFEPELRKLNIYFGNENTKSGKKELSRIIKEKKQKKEEIIPVPKKDILRKMVTDEDEMEEYLEYDGSGDSNLEDLECSQIESKIAIKMPKRLLQYKEHYQLKPKEEFKNKNMKPSSNVPASNINSVAGPSSEAQFSLSERSEEQVLGLDLSSSDESEVNEDDDDFKKDIQSSESDDDDASEEDYRSLRKRKRDYFGREITDARLPNASKQKKKRKQEKIEALKIELEMALEMQRRLGKYKEPYRLIMEDEEPSVKVKKLESKDAETSKKLKAKEQQAKELAFQDAVKEKCNEVIDLLSPLIENGLKKHLLPECQATEYLKTKYYISMNYFLNVMARRLLQQEGEDVDEHPVAGRIAQFHYLFTELDRCKPKYEPQLRKMLEDLNSGKLNQKKRNLPTITKDKNKEEKKLVLEKQKIRKQR